MGRDHARVKISIWTDAEFRAQSIEAQHMYFTLMSQPRLSHCGTLDYLPGRIAQLTAGNDESGVEYAVKTLEASRFVIVDRATQELLIRTFVRHDELLKFPNVVKAMAKDLAAILSDDLRDVVENELVKAYLDNPEMAGWRGLREADPKLHHRVSRKASGKD